MENVIVYSESSSDSIKEIEPPKKKPPLVIDIDTDDIILNVNNNKTQSKLKAVFSCADIPQESPGDNPSHWTDDMKKFYNDDWGDELNFTVEKLQEKMDKHPFLWQVSKRDLLVKSKRKQDYRKCWNCCQYGHNVYKCKEPPHIPKCHMCGVEGHVETGCPNSICLNCGNQMHSYVTHCGKCANESNMQCTRCSLFGHHFINCSDNWRRFHATIGKLEIDIPENMVYKAASELWCCNCGKKGHCQIDCNAKKQLVFPDTFPFIASYDNSFNPQDVKYIRPAPPLLTLRTKCRRRKEKNNFQRNYDNSTFNVMKPFIKSHPIKKHKKKRKKKDRDRNRNKFLNTPDFIPL